MQEESTSEYRPATPDSTFASSLYHATSNIDDLTLALTNFSRVPSPEPQQHVCCCCKNEDCETTKSWLAVKSKLESRLILSAEVGSALLQRHEAYVRRHEDADQGQVEVDVRVAELVKENAVLEKVGLQVYQDPDTEPHHFLQRLTQALLNSEVAEASNKTALHELEEARSAVSRLTAHHARSVGLDTRLAAVLQENDDTRQERDSQAQRARLAESRLAALKDRTDKLQAEVRRLQDDLESRRMQRLESSESLLRDVRSRLEGFQGSTLCFQHVGTSTLEDNAEVFKVLESLVADNEVLKADNEELHKLLTESREDMQALQMEVEEHSILAPPIRVDTPSKHSRTASGPSSVVKGSLFSSTRRPASVEPKSRRGYEPLTPETSRRPLSPADSLLISATQYTNFIHPQPRYPPSHLSFDTDNDPECDQGLLLENHASKAVQTDRWLGLQPTAQLTPSFMDQLSASPHDGRSESSSLLDGQGSPISSLLERMHSLLHRMTQADALTLTNRLKRQHLRGADIKHLSRTTVSNILSEVLHLRAQYRMLLEDEKMTTLCTRKDLRGLFKLFKEVLDEMGQMRVTLNDVILEPSIAAKFSEMALDPAKAEAMEKERKSSGSALGSSWMAPFSKLFGSTSHEPTSQSSTRTPPRATSRGRGAIRVSRPVPKIGPALAASTTTVNVEFSGTGAGKSVTSVFSAHPNNEGARDPFPRINTLPQSPTSTQSNVRSVMGIFAGAPHPDDTSDPWVVLPRAPRRVQSTFLRADPTESGAATIGRSAMRKRHASQLSRGVDAVLDADYVPNTEGSEADDVPGPLLERTLRRRGLSDSSIHSTFTSHGGEDDDPNEAAGPWLDRTSVMQTLSRTMQSFRQVASHTISAAASSPSPSASATGISDSKATSGEGLDVPRPLAPRASSPTFSSLLPNLTSWAAAGAALDTARSTTHPHPPPNFYGSVRDDSAIPRLWGREAQGRDI
ncbi:hypothetical protein HYDPIDRAFT_79094 [Hydnomerulius pinastri MD-312]|nr:hypothetical protein HYDPIDRAFT_79094 [Hydnomerulius pinastri MD-312]